MTGLVSDWSTTAGSNTTVEGINIAEGCPAGNVNNGLRAIMAVVRNSFASALNSFFVGAVPLPVTNGGTGAIDAASARTALGAAASTDVAFSNGSGGTGYWVKRNNGSGGVLIEQWGTATTGAAGFGTAINYPTAFTNTASIVIETTCTDPSYTGQTSATATNTTQFQLGATGAATLVFWRAIGY